MSLINKTILENANAAITAGDYEAFLAYCTEDTTWTFVGDQTLHGKKEVRKYMKNVYTEPPRFMVENLIAEGEFLTAIGKISLKDANANWVEYSYCDIWEFRDGLMFKLKAFVI